MILALKIMANLAFAFLERDEETYADPSYGNNGNGNGHDGKRLWFGFRA